MPSNSVPVVNSARRFEPPGRVILLLRVVSRWLVRRNTRLELGELNDRQLRDIGLERTERGYRTEPGSPAERHRHLL